MGTRIRGSGAVLLLGCSTGVALRHRRSDPTGKWRENTARLRSPSCRADPVGTWNSSPHGARRRVHPRNETARGSGVTSPTCSTVQSAAPRWSDVLRPFPAGLVCRASDRDPAEMNHLARPLAISRVSSGFRSAWDDLSNGGFTVSLAR